MPQASEADILRFFTHVEVLRSGCHFWAGTRSRGRGNRKWYGTFWFDGARWRAHRFADEVLGRRGPLPEGYHRDHTCEFSLCVNPEHIERVTREENERRKQERRKERQDRVPWQQTRSMAEWLGAD